MQAVFRMPCRFIALSLAFITLPCLAADPAPEPGGKKMSDKEVAVAKKAVDAHLVKIKGTSAQVEQIKDAPVLRAMPAYAFFTVRYRQYPIARATPPGLRASNVFAVGRDNKVQVLTSIGELEKFLKTHLPAASSDARIKDDARLALRLGEEFHQDGFFRFTLMDEATKVSAGKTGKSATAKAVVMAGGNGTYVVALDFTKGGKLSAIKEKAAIRSGPRPICQSTKLLDKDPLVRAMAEQALLSMGRPARAYLEEQRAKASPALKKAIDAVWKKICDQDR